MRLIAPLLLLMFAGAASATDYYVATTGDDGYQGNITHPWATITYAATQASAGDTVNIKAGNYGHEHVVISNSGTVGNLITFQGYDGEVIIDGSDTTGYGIYINSKSYIKIEGFNITKYQFGILGMSAHHIIINDSTVYLNYKGVSFQGIGGNNNTVQNITAWNNDMCGIEFQRVVDSLIEDCWSYSQEGLGSYTDYSYALIINATDNIIRDCIAGQYATDGGRYVGHGYAFRHNSSRNQIINCTSYYTGCEHYKTSENSDYNKFINCSGFDSYTPNYCAGFYIKSSNNTVKNCIMQGMDYGIEIIWSTAEPSDMPIQGNIIQNSVFVNNAYGISMSDAGTTPPDNNTVKNCIVVNNTNGIWVHAGVTNEVLEYNDVWNNTNDYTGCSAGTGSISSDPFFADYSLYDYHLKSEYGRWNGASWVTDAVTSSCIDTGNPFDDYSNEPTPNGDTINIGAYGNTVEASKSQSADPSPPNSSDNRLRELSPDTVLGDNPYIDVGIIGSNRYRGVSWFNLSQYNVTDLIEVANLSLFWYYESRNQSTDVGIYRPANWDADYVTWNTRTNGVAWNNPGGDWYDEDNISQGTNPHAAISFDVNDSPDNAYHDFDVTKLVQNYVCKIYDNSGFFIKTDETSDDYIAFYSLEHANASQQPKLTITHSEWSASNTGNYWNPDNQIEITVKAIDQTHVYSRLVLPTDNNATSFNMKVTTT